MNGAKIVVRMLREYGVDVLFGVPGDTSIPLYEALYEAKNRIRHVLARDERSASFMADAYARLSHRPGICECPSGAGPLYSVPGVAEANASSIPVILFTSDIPLSGEGKSTITELDCQGLFKSITKWSCVIKDAKKIPESIRRGFRIATTGRPGAVHMALPQEIIKEEFKAEENLIYSEPECRRYPAYRTRGSRNVLEKLTRHLIKAERPVIIAGGGANHSQAGPQVMELAEWLSAAVVTTISGQGIMPDEHPLAMGVIGDNGFHPHAHQCVEEGDVLLYVGCKMGSVSTINWSLPVYTPERKILQIDLDPELLSNNYRNTLSVAGDARLVLKDVLVLLKGKEKAKDISPWIQRLNKLRSQFWKESQKDLQSNSMPIKPETVIAALNRHLPSPSIVIADAGTPTPYITRYLKLGGKGSRFIIPRAYGGLGYAIPATVGAYFARPDARLIGLFGDGSLGMAAGELETLARLEIPAVLIHFSNACFGWIKALQALHSKGKFYSVDFTRGDPVLVAEGFGLKALRIEDPKNLDGYLEEAFACDRPVFLDVIAESEASHLPPVFSWQKAAEKEWDQSA
ncbi:MAG: thiamine pyrophosphate-binding protein [Deltaproteobacteria bacterium]|nr:thiamine pyrophosphate-binding protein [Deltaproteobacteria bacterium]MBW2128080.1 thiamine pyrophosphate-binding protein [Deltaproteobacteria bacterium]